VHRGISTSDARRFDRLRRGDRVRVEVRPVNNSTAELVRFR
jgi:translation initiation factor IF-1